jgi:hypothetical protein
MPHSINVRKADGTLEAFRMEKLTDSLRRSGATDGEVVNITRDIEKTLVDGMTTEAIYKKAFTLLRSGEHLTAARYSLRRAMTGLGPTGFPFEDYLARLFTYQGYSVDARVELQGKCISHEIDMLAFKEGVCLIGEAKFHAQVGVKSDVQVALYSHARFLDIASVPMQGKLANTKLESYLITNTKFTSMAIQYAECVGTHLLSWDYPKVGNLQELIQTSGLYPVTVLQTLSLAEKRSLLSQGTVLCKDILDNDSVLSSIGVSRTKISRVLDEGSRLCIIK